MRHVWVLLFVVACRPPVEADPIEQASASAPAPTVQSASADVSQDIGSEPDADRDGIPDRCDACPNEPGMLWDDYPVIDGCNTGAFHGLVRVPSPEVIEIAYATKSAQEPAADTVGALAATLSNPSITSLLIVAHATSDEPQAEKLATQRANRLAELLGKKGVKATIVTHGSIGPKRTVEVVVAARDNREEVRWENGVFTHVRTALVQAKKDDAVGKPSPCGRESHAPLPNVPR